LSEDADTLTVKGYAWSGGGHDIVRVDVSLDGGSNWQSAELEPAPPAPYGQQWAWRLWQAELVLPKEYPPNGVFDVVCKAVDNAHNMQPERVEPIWNMRGLLNTSWHHVPVSVPPTIHRIYHRASSSNSDANPAPAAPTAPTMSA